MRDTLAFARPVEIAGRGRSLLSAAGEWWCRAMHDDITLPRHGHYRCKRCGRVYPVPWQEPATTAGCKLTSLPDTNTARAPA